MMMGFAENFMSWIAHRSIEAAILIAIIFLVRWMLGRRLPISWKCALWLIVAIRLLVSGIIPLHVNVPQKIVTMTDLPPVIVHVDLTPTSPSTSEPLPAVHAAAPENISPILIASLIYIAVAALLLLRIIAKHLVLASHVRRMPLAEDFLADFLLNCQRQMAISRPIRLVQTDQIRTPALCGIFRPTIMLPADIEFAPAELRMVLMHELAHAKKNHVFVGLVTQIICALHWLNPMIWLAIIAYRHDRELACDELVLKQLGQTESANYGQCLIRMVKTLSIVPTHPATIGVFGSPNSLRRRIAMISNFQSRRAHSRWVVGAIAFIAIGCGALTTTGESKPPQQATADQPKQADVHPAINSADVTARETLERRIPEVNFDQVPVTDVIDFYRQITGTNIFVNWQILETAGISKNTPITVRLRDVKFSTVLRKTLDVVGGGTVKLGYSVDDGVITISTADDLARNVVTRVYDVRDLLADISDVPEFKPGNRLNSTTAPVANGRREERLNEIVKLITDSIDPTSWRDSGGVVGSIRDFQMNQLIVTQTAENQSAITALLENLREGRSIQIVIESRFITVNPQELSPKIAEMLRPVAPGQTPVSPFVSGPVLDEIIRDTQKTTRSSTVTAPRVTLFNGQWAVVQIGSTTPYVSSYKVTRQANNETHYDPVIGEVYSGLNVAMQATASADRRYVTLTVQPSLKQLKNLEPQTIPGSPQPLAVQRPEVQEQSLNVTTSIPDGETVILRTAPADKDSKEMLFVMLTPKIIVQQQVAPAK